MLAVRRKYQDLDFDELREAMERADQTFFSRMDLPQKVFHGQFMPPRVDNEFVKEKEKHMDKMMRLLPVKYHILSRRRSYKHSGGVRISCTSVCIGGNGKGVAGYGIGKGPSMQEAAERSKEHLAKNLHYLPLHEQRTLFQSVLGKHNQTRVMVKKMPRGRGIKASPMIYAVLDCFGISDASTKIIGRRNPITVLYAIFDGLQKTTPYKTIAQRLGVNYYRHFEPGYYRETPPKAEEMEEQTRKIKELLMFAETTWNSELKSRDALKLQGRYEEPRVSPQGQLRVDSLAEQNMEAPEGFNERYALTQIIEESDGEHNEGDVDDVVPTRLYDGLISPILSQAEAHAAKNSQMDEETPANRDD